MNTVLLTLFDGSIKVNYLIETNLTEYELEKKAKEVVEFFEGGEEYYDWCYDDVVNELEARGCLKIADIDAEYNIRL